MKGDKYCTLGVNCRIDRCYHKRSHKHGSYSLDDGEGVHVVQNTTCPISGEEAPCMPEEDIFFMMDKLEPVSALRSLENPESR
ncbi:hypothetical protein CMI41_03320 [Candidatus Pacearchaeota archaeon]|nr:hypothetical protein [Candidatus Pacearchaeota archaeon]